ncbi:MAG TPA: hypothetical protein VEW68_11090, partial [Patescibacteria group bacterium]|nr:hypothetical protein [Patescibacteria group bacterium]
MHDQGVPPVLGLDGSDPMVAADRRADGRGEQPLLGELSAHGGVVGPEHRDLDVDQGAALARG